MLHLVRLGPKHFKWQIFLSQASIYRRESIFKDILSHKKSRAANMKESHLLAIASDN